MTILHRNHTGYIGHCECCGEIQMAYGSLVCHMGQESFHKLHSALKEIPGNLNALTSEMPDGPRLLLKTSIHNIMISIDPAEFCFFLELFDHASLMLEVHQTLKQV